MLTDEKKKYFRKLLNQKLDEILKETSEPAIGMIEFRENPPDPIDRASEEFDMSFALRIKERERNLARKIKDALTRLDDGTFGVCDECGEDISEGRLRARPVTTLCIECKEKQENAEKTRGL